MAAAKKLTLAKCLKDLVGRRTRVLIDEGLTVKHRPADAISAVHRLLGNERLLNRVWTIRGSKAFDGNDCLSVAIGSSRLAGTCGLTVQQDRATSAFPDSAAELWTVELEVVLQKIEYWHIGVVYGSTHGDPVDR
jgi:hypothetical protein